MKIAIKDIARAMNTSTATVSRAINNHPAIKTDTKERILKYIKEVGYRPNTIAKNLKMQKSNTIGILVPTIGHNFFAVAISAIEKVISEAGYSALICQSHENYVKEVDAIQILISNRVAGVIASISQETTSAEHFLELQAHDIPVVFFDRCFGDEIIASKVICDDFSGSYSAVKYLVKTGYQRIAYLSGPENLHISQIRLEGYKKALKDGGLEYDENLVVNCELIKQGGKDGLQKLMQLDRKPDAVFCVNDPVAIGVYQQLHVYNMKIPDDIAVVGFSNSEIASLIQPGLTTVDQSVAKMGERASQLLINQINEDKEKSEIHVEMLDASLIVRDST